MKTPGYTTGAFGLSDSCFFRRFGAALEGKVKQRPMLRTGRLLLRPFALADASQVHRMAGHFDIAATTLNIPHPYEPGMAEQWIARQKEDFKEGALVNFAIVRQEDNQLVGSIGLKISQKHSHGELGYWIGKDYWNHGYCTEAAVAVIQYGFEVLSLHRIHAYHFLRNPASGRVMQKVGMKYEGRQRQHVRKWDRFEDLELYGILREDRVGS